MDLEDGALKRRAFIAEIMNYDTQFYLPVDVRKSHDKMKKKRALRMFWIIIVNMLTPRGDVA